MTHDPLTIRRLHVMARAPLASRVGFAARIEDALRTSSLPAEWKGRLVLIRRLRLRAGERWPAHLLARSIESTWSAGAMRPVPGVQASADEQAVWFADPTCARLALIERLARGKDVSAWFWQKLLPGGTDVAGQIAQLLTSSDCEMLTAVERIRYFADACLAIADPALIDRVIADLDSRQLRRLLPDSVLRTLPGSDAGSAGQAHGGRRAEPSQSSANFSDESELRSIAQQFARAALRAPPRSLPQGTQNSGRPTLDARAIDATLPEGESAATEWAGLFFVLNLVGQAGGNEDFSVGWLRDVAGWLRVDADDPLHAVLDRLDVRSAEQASSVAGDRTPAPLRELRLACLRASRRPLRRVLRRAGHVNLNRTHLTIALRLTEVSLPVRIAGLDIDPGWVVSLGRVVRFEYD